MRTTVTLDDDVAAAVTRLRRDRHLGLSEALNELARAGMVAASRPSAFHQRTSSMGSSIDLRDIAEAIEIAEGAEHR